MHCEVTQRFAGGSGSVRASRRRWNTVLGAGTGPASRVSLVATRSLARADKRAIPLPMLLLHVARDMSVFLTHAGPEEARPVVERRSGKASEPRLPDLAAPNLADMLAELDETRMWEQALEIEPFPQIWFVGESPDVAFAAIAAFTDFKSPWLRRHSTGVAELAEDAAWRVGLPAASVALMWRPALAHDLGRVGVSNAIWEKPGRLGFGDWERVRLNPYFTERAFAQSPALAPIGILAGRTTNGSTAPATTEARVGRRSISHSGSSLPPATGPCARRGRTGQLWMRRRQRQI
jgi:hypothetical protein